MNNAFRTHVAQEIKRIARRENLTEASAFVFWFATVILELSDDAARESMSVEGANDKGIDLFWVDDDAGQVIVAQAKFSAGLNHRGKVSHLATLESSLNWLRAPEVLRKEGRAELAQAAEDYVEAMERGHGVELWYVCAGPRSENIDKHVAVYNRNPDNLEKRRAMRYYDADMLCSTWEEMEGSLKRIASATLSAVGKSVLLFDGRFGKAAVASIPGSEMVRLYQENRERLFDRNVRLFLGVRKGSVNAEIAKTLNDPKESYNFWAYNNGVTVLCDRFQVGQDSSSIEVVNFSIVNGCQTTISLAQGPEKNVANASVIVRFIAASPEMADDVIQFTNSQNPIRTWDIASQDRTQRRLKAGFENLNKPFIYLTRRGARPKENLRKYRSNGKLRQIRIDTMGQYAAAFLGRPVLAYKHKSFIFSTHHREVFPANIPVEEVLFQWRCGECAAGAVRERMKARKDDEVRVLKKGGALFVTAVMAKILEQRNGPTYLTGASEANITSKSTEKKLRQYAGYALGKYVQAVLDQAAVEEQKELPTLIRSPDFYNKVIDRVERAFATDSGAKKWVSEALPSLSLKGRGAK